MPATNYTRRISVAIIVFFCKLHIVHFVHNHIANSYAQTKMK